MLTDLNQMYLNGWSSTGSSKKIVKECINIVINTLLHVFNCGNHFLLGKHLVLQIFTTKSHMWCCQHNLC